MPTVLVCLPSGAGVVRRDDGVVMVTGDTSEGGGVWLRAEDSFHPAKSSVADRLVISVRTVETHLYRGMQKLGIRDRHDL